MILIRILRIVRLIPGLNRWLNRVVTNIQCNSTQPRPRAFSLWSHMPKRDDSPIAEPASPGEYTSWQMLTDRSYFSRHLPVACNGFVANLPLDAMPTPDKAGDITELFLRKDGIQTSRSSSLFMFFAQWFTDSVLRTDFSDRRKNTSNHNIDLCQIYGLTEETAGILRSKVGGRLRCQEIGGETYLDHLGEIGEDGKWRVKEHYQGLPYASMETLKSIMRAQPEARWHALYATGLERGNSSIGYVAISTLFLREHNRICGELAKNNPEWDDERLFQTARMINIVLLMKLVVVDYINHISGTDIFQFDTHFAEKQKWYRQPWIALEFDMLYRWHALVPESIHVNGAPVGQSEYRFNNALLEKLGFNTIVDGASRSPAGEIRLGNTPHFLARAEYQNIKTGRDFRLKSFNDYREQFGLRRCANFDALTDDRALSKRLEALYGDIENLEFVVGIFAEKKTSRGLFGALMNKMVAYDAFTQIYTNPLLSRNLYHAQTFTHYGLKLIEQTNSIQDLVDRNNQSGSDVLAGFGFDE